MRAPHTLAPFTKKKYSRRNVATRPRKKASSERAALPPRAAPEAIEAAKSAGLRYVSDGDPGITRQTKGKNFSYRTPDGKTVKDASTLGRIKRLAIPPAWTEVWICPSANGHIQATGRDQKRRKQYRYHHEWQATRDQTKYERVVAFGKALPKIRKRVAQDLKLPGLHRNKVLATLVRLLETTLIRIGNEEYAKENHSFGLSTMRDQHVKVEKGKLSFSFRGKSGKRHNVELHDPRIAGIVRQAQDLPGQDLFQYLDDQGEQQRVFSEDVNSYLREVAGEEFSAKDFRTWAGTVLAAMALREFEKFDTKAQAKKNLVQAIERVSQRLGNTPAVCKKCYIHPSILESYLDGTTVDVLQRKSEAQLRENLGKLQPEEAAVLAFVQQRLEKPDVALQLARSLKAERKRRRGKESP